MIYRMDLENNPGLMDQIMSESIKMEKKMDRVFIQWQIHQVIQVNGNKEKFKVKVNIK